MLWSLFKILFFMACLAVIAFGVSLLMGIDGTVMIRFPTWEMALGPLQAVILVLLLAITLWLLIKLIALLAAVAHFVNGDETALSRFFDRNRERRGFQALAQGLMALASDDPQVALTQAKKADKLLNRPDLTHLILAQAAEKSGDTAKAVETYKKLLADDKTRVVGVNGLLRQKIASGETDVALKLAQKALELRPAHMQTQDTVLKLQTDEEDWAGARETLAIKYKKGSLPRDVHRRRDGALAFAEARDLRLLGKVDEAYDKVLEAYKLTPSLVPAAVWAARAHIAREEPKKAEKVILAAWKVEPHPELAAAFAAIAPDETTQERQKRFKKLFKYGADHPESQMAQAELHITAGDFAAANAALGDLADTSQTQRSLAIKAAIEQGQGSDEAQVQDLLMQALKAAPDATWVCESCGGAQNDWDPVCDYCSTFDSLSWKQPNTANSTPPPMLMPLLMGDQNT